MIKLNTRLQGFLRQLCFCTLLALGLLSTLATGGGGGGGAMPNTAPRISNLVLSENTVAFNTGGGRTTIQAQLDYNDPERDLATIQVEISDGSSLSIAIPAVTTTSGTLVGAIEFSTDVSGVYTAEVWIEDRAGNESNRLSATVTILGSADLSSLELTGITLDQAFDAALTAYTATLDFDIDTTTVTASVLDPSATFTVNGTPLDSGVPSDAIDLVVGANTITVQVAAEPGAMSRTYTIAVTRRANARLASLNLSAAGFDQIFQPGQPDYTAAVGFLISSTTVTATTEDPNATVTVNGIAVASGSTSDTITLDPGSNAISVVVSGVDSATTAQYSVDVTRDTVDAFAQRAYVKASNTDELEAGFPGDFFGMSVALSADTMAVGARWEDSTAVGIDGDQSNNDADNSGAVYVFTRNGSGVWSQQAYIKASNTQAGALFGSSIALSGNTLVVGSPSENSSATGIGGEQDSNTASYSGAVYVFTRDDSGVWSQQAYVKASNTDTFGMFGQSVALAGDTMAVGAPGDDSAATGVDGDQDDDNAYGSGAVYLFTRDSAGIWSQQAYVKASNTDVNLVPFGGDRFGSSVALSGDTLAVGAPGEDSAATGINGNQVDNSEEDSGAVYVFTRDAARVWSQQAYVKASNTGGGPIISGCEGHSTCGDNFGFSVALSGDTLAVGAIHEDSSATGIDGDQADNSYGDAGAVYVFVRDGVGNWSQQAYVKASNTGFVDFLDGRVVALHFGFSVAVSGDTLVASAPREISAATGINGDQSDTTFFQQGPAGAVYVFARDGLGTWSQLAYVKASNTGFGDQFGSSVALSEDTLAVGAPGEASSSTGIDGDQGDGDLGGEQDPDAADRYSDAGAVYVFD